MDDALLAKVEDNVAQQRERDPTDILESDDVDAAMQFLMEQANDKEWKKIDSMSPADKRQLAETSYRDPDTAEQLMRWRKHNPRHD